jgi:trk system potassium uptake protein
MKIVVVGGGRSGTNLSARLARSGHQVTLIDRDEAVARKAFEQFGLATLTGDGTDPGVLREAEVDRAEVLAALLRRDADNLAVALLAREMGAQRIMVRMRDAAYRGVYKAAGVQEVLSEVDVLVGALMTAVEHPKVSHSMVLGGGESLVFEVIIPIEANVAGKTVRELATDPAFPRGCAFAAVADETGHVTAPRGDSIVRGGSSVSLVSAEKEIGAAVAFLTAVDGGKRAAERA